MYAYYILYDNCIYYCKYCTNNDNYIKVGKIIIRVFVSQSKDFVFETQTSSVYLGILQRDA